MHTPSTFAGYLDFWTSPRNSFPWNVCEVSGCLPRLAWYVISVRVIEGAFHNGSIDAALTRFDWMLLIPSGGYATIHISTEIEG